MRSFLAAVAALVFLGLPCAANGLDKKAVEEGRDMAQRLCARCHAIGAEGESPLKEAPLFRTFAQQWPIESLAEAFAEGIVTGHEGMPEFVFQPAQIDAMLSYLDSIQAE